MNTYSASGFRSPVTHKSTTSFVSPKKKETNDSCDARTSRVRLWPRDEAPPPPPTPPGADKRGRLALESALLAVLRLERGVERARLRLKRARRSLGECRGGPVAPLRGAERAQAARALPQRPRPRRRRLARRRLARRAPRRRAGLHERRPRLPPLQPLHRRGAAAARAALRCAVAAARAGRRASRTAPVAHSSAGVEGRRGLGRRTAPASSRTICRTASRATVRPGAARGPRWTWRAPAPAAAAVRRRRRSPRRCPART